LPVAQLSEASKVQPTILIIDDKLENLKSFLKVEIKRKGAGTGAVKPEGPTAE
jgi:hypothetical protein